MAMDIPLLIRKRDSTLKSVISGHPFPAAWGCGAANTWKEFLIHLGTISIGLLIAIGLEQSVALR